VTGDTVNTAARLQAAARPGAVLLGELTTFAVAEGIETTPAGPIELKGKSEPVRCAEAVAPRSHPSREQALGELRAPMLGRAAELQRLQDASGTVRRERSAARVLVVAPPGVGKSRLLRELAADHEGSVLVGRVRPQATAPYETVAQLIASTGAKDLAAALAGAGIPPARAAVIEGEVARLTGGGDAAPVTGGDLAAERKGRFDAWLTAIDALADDAETWLVEDVHWAGGDLLAFLDHAGRAGSRHGRLVIATSRPSLLESDPAWCEAASDRLELGPLPAADAGALITALLGSQLPQPLVDTIVERSDGTPLFIEELLRTWASVGTLIRGDGRWELAVEPGSVVLPPTVQAIYAAQLDDLPPDARMVARRGSVAGRRVPTGALGALEADSTDGLDGLHRRALLAGPLHDPVTGESYAFRHALLRDAGYASLARAERARLHVAMARWLAGVAGARADVVAEGVAEHYAEALASRPAIASDDLPSRALLAADASAWYERAAEAALRLAAHEACRRLLGRSIELTDPAATLDLGRRRRRLGEVLAASADLDAGIVELEAALACCPDDPASVAASAYALGRAYMQQIRFEEAERITADTLARLAGEPDALLARLRALHAWTVAAQGRDDGVLAEVELARETARRADDPYVELDVLDHAAAARDELDASSDAEWAELEERARTLGAWRHVISAARVRAVYTSFLDPAAALPALEETAELARAHGQLEQAGWCDYSRCETLFLLGRWDEALALGTAIVDLAERNAYERLAFRTYVVLLPMAAERRDPSMADRYRVWHDATAERLPTVHSPYARVLRAAIEAWSATARGERPPAPPAETLEAFIPMINAHFIAAMETLGRAWLDSGRTDLASAAGDRIAEFAAEDDATPLMRASSTLIGSWIGRAEPTAAVEAAHATGAPWWIARALRAAGASAQAEEVERGLGIPQPA
jgi:tetratricopeptide (TPR) repeat protein